MIEACFDRSGATGASMGLLRCMLAMLATAFLGLALPGPALAGKIVAVGDLHGDYEAFLDILEAAGLADGAGRWTAGDTVFVQLGDVTDRGPDSLKIIRLLDRLEKAAPADGGQVIALVGNHEAMNLTGDLRYVHPGEYAAFANANSTTLRERVYQANKDTILAFYRQQGDKVTPSSARRKWMEENPLGKLEHRLAWRPTGEMGKWLVGKPAIALVGDTIFVHGGISVETAARPLEAVNAEVGAELAKGESLSYSILTDELGPLWYRGNVVREEPAPLAEGETPAPARPGIEEELGEVLAAWGAKRLVVAHTPHPPGIVASHDGRLVRVDTAISAYYGGVRSYLVIEDGQATAWRKDKGSLWVSEGLSSPQ